MPVHNRKEDLAWDCKKENRVQVFYQISNNNKTERKTKQ